MTISEICKDDSAGRQEGMIIEIPVCYGGESVPDLEELAAFHGMSADEVIQHHSCYSAIILHFKL